MRLVLLGFLFIYCNTLFAHSDNIASVIAESSVAVVKVYVEYEQQNIPPQLQDFFGRSVPRLRERQQPVHSTGSGFIITSDGYIVTNHHVVRNAKKVSVRLIDRSEFDAEVIGSDELSDIALLKIKTKDRLPTLRISDQVNPSVGSWVVAIGSPFNLDYSASAGIVSAIGRGLPDRQDIYVPFIQTDVAINPGNSGGPLLNMQGDVIGVNSQIYSKTGGYQGVSFAVPASVVKKVVADLRSDGKVKRGWLGVTFQEIDRDLAESFDLDKPAGALIVEVQNDSPANKAGIKSGDIILRVGKKKIEYGYDLPKVIGLISPGTKVKVILKRKGRSKIVTLTVGDLETHASNSGTNNANSLGLALVNLPQSHQLYNKGVGVKLVKRNSIAASAGIKQGDVITQIGDALIIDVESFHQALNKNKKSRVPIKIIRRGRKIFLALNLVDSKR